MVENLSIGVRIESINNQTVVCCVLGQCTLVSGTLDGGEVDDPAGGKVDLWTNGDS